MVRLNPSAIYKINSQRVVTSQIDDLSAVISNDDGQSMFLVVFDVQNIAEYAEVTDAKMYSTIIRRPTSDRFSYNLTFIDNVVQDIGIQTVIGNERNRAIEYNSVAGQTFPIYYDKSVHADSYDRLCAVLKFTAYTSQGYQTTDQEFQFQNFYIDLTFGTTGVFSPVMDFGGGYHDETEPLNIQMSSFYNKRLFKQHEVVSGTLYYKLTSASAFESKAFTGNVVELESGTFSDASTYDLYVNATSASGANADSATVELTTIDTTSIVSGTSPNNSVMHGDIRFEWSYSTASGASQYAFDLQVSFDNGSTWSDVASHIVSEDTFYIWTQSVAGNTLWRVRGYNQNDVAGEWSNPLLYLNNVPPQPPVIRSFTGTGRQTVSWSSGDQIAYEIQVLNASTSEVVYDSGEVYSTASSAFINEYLKSGTYIVRIRVSSSLGGWSEWATMTKTIAMSLPAPVFTVSKTPTGVEVNIERESNVVHYYLLRNGIPIADIDGATYIDSFVSGDAEYRLVAVDSSDAYGYSTQSISFAPEANLIILEDGTTISVNQRWDARVLPEKSVASRYGTYFFLGDDRPSHIFSRGRTGTYSVAAFDSENIFESMLGQHVFFSASAGWGGWAIITSMNRAERLFGNEVMIQMEFDSFEKRIEYAV